MDALTIAWPWVWILLPLPWLLSLTFRKHAQENTGGAAIPFPAADSLIAASQHHQARANNLWPLWLIWIFLLTALCRPQWQGEPLGLPSTGRDLLLVVDISGSMETPDMEIDGQRVARIVAVKKVVGDFASQRLGDRLGLVLFGSQAYLQTPLTFDRQTLVTQLREAQLGFAGERTAIGDALALAAKRLKDRQQQSRVIILLTDGANTDGSLSPLQGADIAQQMGIKIYTIGMGAEVMIHRGLFGSQRVNPSADLDEPTLQEIAEKTGGAYFRARSTDELGQIYQMLDALEPSFDQEKVVRPIVEYYHWSLAAALLLSVLLILRAIWKQTRVEP